MNPTKFIQQQKLKYYENVTNRIVDTTIRVDIKNRLDIILGDNVPIFLNPLCCHLSISPPLPDQTWDTIIINWENENTNWEQL